MKAFLENGKTPEFIKSDFDPSRPLYTEKSLPADKLEQFSILIKGKTENSGIGGIREINGTERGVILHGRSLLNMYERIVRSKISGITDNRLIIETTRPDLLSPEFAKIPLAEWKKDNIYSYELIVPVNQQSKLFEYALEDLNRYTPFKTVFEKRRMFCWTLEKDPNSNLIKSKGGSEIIDLENKANPELRNTSVMNLCIYLYDISNKAIILDQTGFTENIDIKLGKAVKDMAAITRSLKAYGLRLTSGYKEIDMLVIKDK
jgi:hypothetical protein